jgi:hypothetical protein
MKKNPYTCLIIKLSGKVDHFYIRDMAETFSQGDKKVKVKDYTELRDLIIDEASKHVIAVEFEKADGTTRVLKGTLDLKQIPKEKHPKGLREVNEEVVALFDVELGNWRSFRLDSIKRIN